MDSKGARLREARSAIMKHTICIGMGTILLGWILAAGTAQAADPYWVEAEANTRLVKCGEPFRFVLTAGAQNGWVRLPGKTALFPECHILDYQEKDVSRRHEGYLARQGVYSLAVFALDSVILPPQQVIFTGADGQTATAESLPIQLGIQTLSPAEGLSLINPRPPRKKSKTLWYVSAAAGLLLLAFWVGSGIRRRPRRQAPLPPPHLEAIQLLDDLGKSKLVAEATNSDRYFTELSRILRQYLARRYHFPAMEMSGSAILEELMRRGVEAKRRELIGQLLEETDLVKFAQERVDHQRVAAVHGLAREIILLTREGAGMPPNQQELP